MSKHTENAVADACSLAGLQAKCPSVPANILEIVARLPDVMACGWVVTMLAQLEGVMKIEARRATISQVAGMFRYAYAIDRVRERDYDEIEQYLGQLLRVCYE